MIKEVLNKPEINFWVGLVLPLLAIAAMWGSMGTKVSQLEDMTLGLQDTYTIQREQNTRIQVQLAEIQKDVLYIKAELAQY